MIEKKNRYKKEREFYNVRDKVISKRNAVHIFNKMLANKTDPTQRAEEEREFISRSRSSLGQELNDLTVRYVTHE